MASEIHFMPNQQHHTPYCKSVSEAIHQILSQPVIFTLLCYNVCSVTQKTYPDWLFADYSQIILMYLHRNCWLSMNQVSAAAKHCMGLSDRLSCLKFVQWKVSFTVVEKCFEGGVGGHHCCLFAYHSTGSHLQSHYVSAVTMCTSLL